MLIPEALALAAVAKAIGVPDLVKLLLTRVQARADADAMAIRAEGQANAEDILAIAAQDRILKLELRRQENLLEVLVHTARVLPADVQPEPLDEDWVVEFMNNAQDIGNKDMQKLWGRILAGEIRAPRSFSRRTLAFVRQLSQDEAALFARYSVLLWRIDGLWCYPDDSDLGPEGSLENAGITSVDVLELEALGLTSNSLNSEQLHFDAGHTFTAAYHRRIYEVTPQDKDFYFQCSPLPRLGSELAPICQSDRDERFEEAVTRMLEKRKCLVRRRADDGETVS